ncbi:MAG: DUF4384 domain-containing protein [Desulfomonilaceae bacterium]
MKALTGIRWFIALMAVCIFTMGLTTASFGAGKEASEKAKQVVAEARKIENPNPGFQIKLWAEGDKKSFKAGDTVAFKFTSSENAYVTLLSIATDGQVYKIFPNKWHKDGKVEKGKEYTFPPSESDFVFRVKGPEGIEYIKAIATLDPLPAASEVKADPEQPMATVEKPEEAMKNVAVELKKREQKTWAESLASFEITEAKPEKK